MAKRVQDYLPAENIVPQAVFSPADTPLSITGLEPGKLLDFVLPAAVVRIFSKDRQQFFRCVQKRCGSSCGLSKLSFKRRRRDNSKLASHSRDLLLGFGGRAPQSSEEFTGIPCLPTTILLVTLPDLSLEPGVLQIQVVFQFVHVHDAGHGNPVLFQDEVLPIEMRSPDHLAEVDPRPSNRYAVHNAFHGLGSLNIGAELINLNQS